MMEGSHIWGEALEALASRHAMPESIRADETDLFDNKGQT
jgi:hypothetical protein